MFSALFPALTAGFRLWTAPIDAFQQGMAYSLDAVERSWLYLDAQRQRSNQYLAHTHDPAPNLLIYATDLLLDGRTLPRPVNYRLMRVHPPEGVRIDDAKRPFIIIDPRAGHGPGIGGFKADSELGVAMSAGHPCYFVSFLRYPEHGQTIEDVVDALSQFISHVRASHPEADSRPMVIGNCQAGWQLMMAAALAPEDVGPILIAGTPLSYWAGHRGGSPMRYTAGLTGGSWITTWLGDLGGGLFDGAWLVSNFESLNPANTWWQKQYALYARVDTEVPRYLNFERWWGGHVFSTREEMEYIVDNLFMGNRLTDNRITFRDGRTVDLRHVRSPVIVFCSEGDDITPPPQALGWLTDLYSDEDALRDNDQTVLYCVHDHTGHLGIFVSGDVSRRQHTEFTSNVDFIDVLPPGLYEASVQDSAPDTANPQWVEGTTLFTTAPRTFDELSARIDHREEDDRRFATVDGLSRLTHQAYTVWAQPYWRAMVTPPVTDALRQCHPLRLGFTACSDHHPAAPLIKSAADHVRTDRHPVSSDNLFLAMETATAAHIVTALNQWRDQRDRLREAMFMALYGQHWLQRLVGVDPDASPVRPLPACEPPPDEFVPLHAGEITQRLYHVDHLDLVVRAMLYVFSAAPAIDERHFNALKALNAAHPSGGASLADLKQRIRCQAHLLTVVPDEAITALARPLVRLSAAQRKKDLAHLTTILTAGTPLDKQESHRLERIRRLFTAPSRTDDHSATTESSHD
ncbi:DUF3141 domain-containing protein [Larsenimonas rhizosphaerae]|uniref:DUF3141 domain-containing protein n=1 Tax=Larsenimonas rhizosphaerae TaxID=2944682 RepID=A0AA41ZK00_9GAMM|nr:DUF3141 domain-containing protein [Larsenimonas rhizosphaerae]MCX2523003.1 DUF3141 domain-containing protein [Larsenimonas rhizosphaerae]